MEWIGESGSAHQSVIKAKSTFFPVLFFLLGIYMSRDLRSNDFTGLPLSAFKLLPSLKEL